MTNNLNKTYNYFNKKNFYVISFVTKIILLKHNIYNLKLVTDVIEVTSLKILSALI